MRWISLLLCFFSYAANATNYYISVKGTADNLGTTRSAPWNYQRLQQELAKKKGNIFWAGDSILLQRGSTFFGPLQVRCSGGAGRPITIGAYGQGARPIISGLANLYNWQPAGDRQYETKMPAGMPASCAMLLINGSVYGQGRFPNSNEPDKGYLTNESVANDFQSFQNERLRKTFANWKGATLVARLKRFVIDTATVFSQHESLLQTRAFQNQAQKGYGFFLTNHPATIDKHGEWYFNPVQQSLRLQLDAPPNRYRIQVPVVDTLFACSNQQYIVVQDIAFEGAATFGIFFAYAPHNTIQRCTVSACGQEGIAVGSQGNNFFKVVDNTISDCGNFGISARFIQSNCTISGNTVRRIGILEQSGGYGTVCRIGILNDRGTNHDISYNQIDSCGNIGIRFKGSDVAIHHNLVQYYGLVMDDVGGIYTVNQGKGLQKNRKVYRNIVVYGQDAMAGTPNNTSQTYGIYIDDGSMDVELYENFIAYGGGAGFYLHNAASLNMHHNTVFGFREAGVRFTYDETKWEAPTDIRFAHNLVVGTNNKSTLLKFLETRDSSFIPLQATNRVPGKVFIDSNYYARPYGTTGEKVFVGWHMYQKGKQQTRRYSLQQFNQFYGLEKNSRESAVQLNGTNPNNQNLLVIYNAKPEASRITLREKYMDVYGKIYPAGPLTLGAFEGKVLINASRARPKKGE